MFFAARLLFSVLQKSSGRCSHAHSIAALVMISITHN